MTQTAMVRGLARWAEKNMSKRFTAGGLTRIGFDAFTRIAESNPVLAVQMALVKYPSLAPIITTVKDAATFETTWNALEESVDENGCATLNVQELFGPMQIFRIGRGDLDAMRSEMESAYKEELAAAKSIEAAGRKL
jgi:hypothetical protein